MKITKKKKLEVMFGMKLRLAKARYKKMLTKSSFNRDQLIDFMVMQACCHFPSKLVEHYVDYYDEVRE